MAVFKAYDVRGTYPDQVNEDLYRATGQAAVKVLGATKVVVGRDMRASGESLSQALIEGLTRAGADVIDIGMASTPMVYFATVFLKAGMGIQVTASHNPAQYNGMKFCRESAIPVAYDTGLSDIEKSAMSGDFTAADKVGSVSQVDIRSDYIAQLLKFADNIKPLTVAVDAGNGVMGAFLPALFEKLPCELIPMYFEPDGTFPNHEANPLDPETMRDLQKKVQETGANIGVAYDGDGDRSMYVDENGEIVPCDAITALLANEMLSREPGATIVYDLRSSQATPEEIERLGGKPLMSRVGHSFIKKTMREHNAIFAGELSGHFYFRDLSFTDNAEMAMLAVFTMMSKTGKKLSELVAPFKKYSATGEINFEVEDTAAKIKEIEEHYAPSAKEVMHLDGLSVYMDGWWFNLRPSNTEPVLRINLEASDDKLRDEKYAEVEKMIKG